MEARPNPSASVLRRRAALTKSRGGGVPPPLFPAKINVQA
jgi:hypothetical protein